MTAWIARLSESKVNYWSTYLVDLGLMTFFLIWDFSWLHEGAGSIVAFYVIGVFAWTLTEYIFHRWVYHLEFGWLFSNGHDKHHENPTSYVAMPWFVTPVLFLPLQLVVAGWYTVHGFSSFVAGWFGGFVAYSFMHHSLHHYKLPFAWYRHLQSQHRIHHALPETNYGVTMRFWDRVFGTEFVKPR